MKIIIKDKEIADHFLDCVEIIERVKSAGDPGKLFVFCQNIKSQMMRQPEIAKACPLYLTLSFYIQNQHPHTPND